MQHWAFFRALSSCCKGSTIDAWHLGRTGASVKHLCEEVALQHFFLSDHTLSMGALPEFGRAACKALHCAARFACQLEKL